MVSCTDIMVNSTFHRVVYGMTMLFSCVCLQELSGLEGSACGNSSSTVNVVYLCAVSHNGVCFS